jgi:CHAT domain-containing protein
MRHIVLVSLYLLFSVNALAASNTDLLNNAQRAFEQGHFEMAIKQWESILPRLSSARQQINVLLQLAAAYQSLGLAQKSIDLLEKALPIAKRTGDHIRQSLVLGSLSDLSLLMGDLEKAMNLANSSYRLACVSIQNPLACATALNYQGNVLSKQGDLNDALDKYRDALNRLHSANAPVLRAKLLSNIVQLQFELEKFHRPDFDAALSQINALPNSDDQVFGLLKLGYLAIERADMTLNAYQILQDALQLAQRLSNTRAEVYAIGYLGKLYLKHQRYEEAERFTQQAIFLTNAPEMQYLWQSQLGDLRHAQKDWLGAIAAYQQAVNHLEKLRVARLHGYRTPTGDFSKSTESVYYQFADLSLQIARDTGDETERQNQLKNARKTLELLKAVELENYFQDDCVTKLQAQRQQIDDILTEADTAVLYPMIFSDRIELLLSFSDNRLEQFSVHQSQKKVSEQLKKFRQALKYKKKDRHNYYNHVLPAAQTLYDWLMAPIATRLKQRHIDTLIIVPDRLLRTIPFAALYDNVKKQFLIEQYTLAVTPGLTLTLAPKKVEPNINLLMAGLSEKRLGFSPLPNALKPIEAIENKAICSKISSTSLKNHEFDSQKLTGQMKKIAYNLVYFSTHAQFDRNPKNSFVLTYDRKLYLDDLKELIGLIQFREQPIELLMLSGCETALGDQRAALGLAGIAVKTGTLSAVGSLWKVADDSTAELMESFFQQLCDDSTLSKAKALQKAQLQLLNKYREYPFYWAPFLLIGNWF